MSRKSTRVLALGIPKLDEFFPGFQNGDFAVLVGRPLCTKLSFLLSVRCQLPLRKGGLNSRVVYIDGGNTFDPYVVSAIAQEYGLEPRSVLKRIVVSRAFTVYQLTALVFERLEETLKRYRSKLVVISDICGLFLDRDVPKIEGRNLFLKITRYLLEVASRRQAIVVASYFPRLHPRSHFLEAVLFGRTGIVISFKECAGGLKFVLEDHPSIKPFTIDLPSNPGTMDMFIEA
ncbi:MAG: hypothetical protein JSW19_01865 [Candidatus Bathyarchaeota archaeon]|nr:MAG: hypothetical protein JSW19_01865 [Candidatus Bathyarchaeota archaeon]